MTARLPLFLLCLLAAHGWAAAARPAERTAPERLTAWAERFAARPTLSDEHELRPLLQNVRGHARAGRGERRESILALLDLYGAAAHAARSLKPEQRLAAARVEELATDEFGRLLDARLAGWMAREVLVRRDEAWLARRVSAARLLAGRNEPEVAMALSMCARERELELRAAAYDALAGRQTDSVHALFLQLLTQPRADTSVILLGAAEVHFRETRLEAGTRLTLELAQVVLPRLIDPDWREATRAVAIARALPDEAVVPTLIEALAGWIARAANGELVRRLEHDLVTELERRSGRSMGPHPERWRRWWQAVLEGRVSAGGDERDGPSATATTAAFYGLRPVTDRVTFVIDRSGSAWVRAAVRPAPFEGTSRGAQLALLEQAVEQMMNFLQRRGAQRTRFNVVLVFRDGRDSLGARTWLAAASAREPARRPRVAPRTRQAPRSDTLLRGGVSRAAWHLRLQRPASNLKPTRGRHDHRPVRRGDDRRARAGCEPAPAPRALRSLRLMFHSSPDRDRGETEPSRSSWRANDRRTSSSVSTTEAGSRSPRALPGGGPDRQTALARPK